MTTLDDLIMTQLAIEAQQNEQLAEFWDMELSQDELPTMPPPANYNEIIF